MSILFNLGMVSAQEINKPEGTGAQTSPYKIASLSNLFWLSQSDSIWNRDTMYYEQTANIDASTTSGWSGGFPAIGNANIKFAGTYNGKGYIIQHLTIDRSETDTIGLFGCTNQAIIDSVGLVNCNIKGDYCTGGIVGVAERTSINYCYTTGTINGKHHTGGIVGDCTTSSQINHCYSLCSITATQFVGGITGHLQESSSINHSYATGDVDGTVDVGGLVGEVNFKCNISNCYASGQISSDGNCCGGLVGSTENKYNNNERSTISNCYATGNATGKSAIGGLIGALNDVTISNCYAIGKVAARQVINGVRHQGGLIGNNYSNTSSVTGCYYNTETNISTVLAVGFDNGNLLVTGLTTDQMKQTDSFTNWDIANSDTANSFWGIIEGNTYPALKGINNAPFAMRDSIVISYSVNLDTLLYNDYDYETGQHPSLYKIISWTNNYGSINGNIYSFNSDAPERCTDIITYCVGEVIATEDTLWSGYTESRIIKSAPKMFISSNSVEINNGLTTPSTNNNTDFGIIRKGESITKQFCIVNIGSDTLELTGEPLVALSGSGSFTVTQQPTVSVIAPDDTSKFNITFTSGTEIGSLTVNVNISNNDSENTPYTFKIQTVYLPFEESGTNNEPIIISNFEDLINLSKIDYLWDKEYYFEQTANIDASETKNWNNETGFIPIGNDSTKFKGYYNGKGHIINGLHIKINSTTAVYAGLFGYVDSGSIDSLGLLNGSISVSSSNTVISSYVGGIIGYSKGTISNCYNTSNMIVTTTNSNINSGGITGVQSSSEITNCYNTGNISASSPKHSYSGGIAGQNQNTLNNCYNIGNIEAEYSGGITGYNVMGSISNCYNLGNSTATKNSGGIVGSTMMGSITNCYWDKENCTISGATTNSNGTGLTFAEMKQPNSFDGWDFENVWGIIEDNTYPALRSLNNAPFAFADSISTASSTISIDSLLSNDYDYENLQENLFYKQLCATNHYGTISSGIYTFNSGVTNGSIDTIVYQLGELITESDTLWSNQITAYLVCNNGLPTYVSDNLEEESILIYTADNYLIINSDKPGILSLFDMNGHQVYANSIFTGESKIKLPQTNMMYVVHLQTKNGIVVKKVMD